LGRQSPLRFIRDVERDPALAGRAEGVLIQVQYLGALLRNDSCSLAVIPRQLCCEEPLFMDDVANNIEAKSPKPKESDRYWSFFFLCVAFLVLLLLDQLVKHFVASPFLNYNFAFSLPVPVLLMYIIYFVVIAAMVYYVSKNHKAFSFFSKLAWTLIFAGAASNIGERIVLGHVRDFIYISFYKWTGVYNLADGYIIVGIILLFLKNELRSKN
jgi:lipoprotein signal peptidase